MRAIQEREVTPLGSTTPRKIDVRVIAATHRDLSAMVAEGTFRHDLFYRIQVVPIRLPALIDRKEDIELLATAFAQRFCDRYGRDTGFAMEALRTLKDADWPGNVRQLENLVERCVLLTKDRLIYAHDLPALEQTPPPPPPVAEDALPLAGLDLRKALERYERSILEQALERTQGNRNHTARLLRMNRTMLVERLKNQPHLAGLSTKFPTFTANQQAFS